MEKTYKVRIEGNTPLLQHRFNGGDGEQTTKKKASTMKENDVEETIYRLPDGTIYQPGDCIKQSMIEAGKAFKKGKSNLSKPSGSFLMVLPDAIPHINQEWVKDRRAVVIPSTKGRVMRNRAKFEDWTLDFEIKCLDDDELDKTTIQNLLEHSGKYVGIGDYRPQKKGMFGTFSVTNFEEA